MGGGGLLSPFSIFLLVAALQVFDRFLEFLKKRGKRSGEQRLLRQEINQLLKEASSLSTPSTFAQAAKLRRLAAAKERELVKYQEEESKEKKWSYDSYARVLMISKYSCRSSSSTSLAAFWKNVFLESWRCCHWPNHGWNNTMANFDFSSQQVLV